MLRTLKSLSTLQWALALSVLLHGAMLTVHFVNSEGFQRAFRDTTLDVVLVNASSEDRPKHAQAIAQANLAGGGDAADQRIASTSLPPTAQDAAGNALITQNQRQIAAMQQEQQQLIAQIKTQLADMPRPDPKRKASAPETRAQEDKREQLSKLLAAIERQVQEQNSRPRKRWLSPATLGSIYALYYDDMRRKIEDRGTRDFPQVGGNKLYGELLMGLLVNHDGRVLDVRVLQGSGDPRLDRFAEAIAESAGPFGPFTPAMRQDTDQFDITARFRFTHEQTLETTLQTDALTDENAQSQPSGDNASGAQ
ncbi:MAG: TonB family protein [Burkholderiaceae bacterium]|jgi:protein TonB|nr:TonB family protein [Burkholderiaceae bacterium]